MSFASPFLFLATTAAAASNASDSTWSNGQDQQRQGWTSEPNCGTGTASIIWQCLVTIGLCIYIAVHLNVPLLPLSSVEAFARKVIKVLTGLLLPEIWAYFALAQLLLARDIKKRAKGLGRSLTMRQAFFICSDGILFRDQRAGAPSPDGRLWFYKWSGDNGTTALDGVVAIYADAVPGEDHIQDKSKQDTLGKIVASCQAVWTLVQIIARGQQGLAVAPAQVATVGFIAMAAFSYACWWHKPYDVSMPHIVENNSMLNDGPLPIGSYGWDRLDEKMKVRDNHFVTEVVREINLIARFLSGIESENCLSSQFSLGAFTMVFGGLHGISWNYGFPTPTEAWFWRIAMLHSVTLGLCIILMGLLDFEVQRGYLSILTTNRLNAAREKANWAMDQVGLALVCLYIPCRLFIIIECIIAFRNAPSSVYQQVDWSSYFPHIGA